MNIFAAIYDFIQAVREAILDLLQPLLMPDWAWLVTVILPLGVVGLVVLYVGYLVVRFRRNAWANVDRRPLRLEGRLAPPPGVHASAPSWWPIALSVGFFFGLLGLIAGPVLLVAGVVVTLLGGWGWLRSATREWRRAELSPEHGGSAHALTADATASSLPAGAAPGGLVPPSRALVPAGPRAVAAAGTGAEHELEAPPGVHMPTPSWWPVYASLAAFFGLLGLVASPALLVGGIVLALLAVLGWYRDAYRELKVAEGLVPRLHERDPRALYPRFLAPIGMTVAAVSVAAAVLPGVVSGLFPAGGGGAGAACTPPPTSEITARNTAFSTKELCLPANVPFQIVFTNDDAGIPHNVAIPEVTFSGEVFNGVATMTYDVPPLAPGTYQFICIVHPTAMKGTAIVVAAGPTPGGSPAGSPPGASPGVSASPSVSP